MNELHIVSRVIYTKLLTQLQQRPADFDLRKDYLNADGGAGNKVLALEERTPGSQTKGAAGQSPMKGKE